jgi:integrase
VLEQDELAELLSGFRRYALYPLVVTAAFTGARRNELLALRWSDLDLTANTLTIRRALETTKAHGFRYKEPKTNRGVRTIAIDDSLAALLAAEGEKYLRLTAGVGQGTDVDLTLVKLHDEMLIFPSMAGGDTDLTRPRHPASVTVEFLRICAPRTRRFCSTLGFRSMLSPLAVAMMRRCCSGFTRSVLGRRTQARRR